LEKLAEMQKEEQRKLIEATKTDLMGKLSVSIG
jgi:hypothetical protein